MIKMKIEDKRRERVDVFFDDLYIGDTFEYDECLWIKCGDDIALNLNDEEIGEFGARVCVIRVNTVITIVD